jgi:beta-lactamase regulating signal transducer with metallopeptidase domain/protocatechuate 3,4-dioxygenase beta subunit
MRDTWSAVIDGINRAGVIHWDFASTMFVQVVALVAILGLVELCLRRRVRPVVRYWLWALVILKLMLPVSLRTPASLAYWVRSEPQPAAMIAIPAADLSPASQPVGNPQDIETRPLEEMAEMAEMAERALVNDSPIVATPQRSEVPSIPSDASPAAVALPHALPHVDVYGWLFLAWCGGCLVLGGMVFRRAAKVHRLGHGAGEAPREIERSLKVACELLHLSRRRIRAKISDEVGCPAVCGFWRPTILIPQRLVGQLDEEQLQFVFAHELIHWKRWDLQLNLLQTLLQIVYFYNPAVWLANAVLRRLREEAVDDAVLVALAAPAERYSHTLLEVAAQTLRPIEAGVRLIGILESRPALVRRICRLAIHPLPRSACLGLGGFVAVALTGVALLPMAGGPRAANTALPIDDADRLEGSVALRGRITDETGKPIADARIQLVATSNKRVREVRTAPDGGYAFQRPAKPGGYAILIARDGFLGFPDPKDSPHIALDSQKQIVRDFSLSKACRLRVQTVDESGRPIAGVRLLTAGLAKIDPKGTDRDGWITIEGMKPTAYVFAAERDDLVTTRLDVTIDSPSQVVERRLVHKRGKQVKGKLVSWDGKPAAGWEVVAVPTWWLFPQKPRGRVVGPDGTFVLPQVGPGKYNVFLVVPSSGISMPLIAGVDLSNQSEPLSLRADLPSPGWQCAIDGHVHFVREKPAHPIGVFAQSLENDGFRDRAMFRGDTFRLGPIPPGQYRLTFESPEIKTKVVQVVAPAAGLKVDIEANSPIPIHGVVSVAGAKGLEPLANFRVRALQWHDPFGTKFASRRIWRSFKNPEGKYSGKLPGPGMYIVEAAADGYAMAQSRPINAEHLSKEGVNLTLTKLVRLSGIVIDESGRPIDGAIVNSLAKAEGHLRAPIDTPRDGTFAKTANGRFEFDELAPGADTFRVDHGDYVSTVVENVTLPRAEPLRIVMKRGATVYGHVGDNKGQPLQGVKLHVWRTRREFPGDLDIRGLATVVTDARGYYEFHGLPEQLVQIRRLADDRFRGLFFKSVMPSATKMRSVDFGAHSIVTGRLFVDGKAMAGRQLMLGDEDVNNGSFGATCTSDADGSFVFSGVPQGKWSLHFQTDIGKSRGWIRVRAVDVHSVEQSLGRIDFGAARLTVNVAGVLNGPRRHEDVWLYDYNPTPFRRRYVLQPNPHKDGSQFVFGHVGFGKYDLVANAGFVRFNQTVGIAPGDLNPAVTMTWPSGTASLEGTIDFKVGDQSTNVWMELASPEERWSERSPLSDGRRFRFAGIPAGRYTLSVMPLRLATVVPVLVAELSIRDGEAKVLAITKASVPPAEFSKGVLKIDVYTADGVPLPGAEISLQGAKGGVKPQLARGAHSFIVAPAGIYDLWVAYPGHQSVSRTVEIKPVLENATWSSTDHDLGVVLTPNDQTPRVSAR